MSPLKLWLIRHGETEVNSGSWSAKPAQTCLTPLGRDQALQTAEKVKEKPDLIILSPLIRAEETAQFFLDQWPGTPRYTWPIQEFIYLSPSRLSGLDKGTRKKEIQAYWLKNDPYFCDGDDAESFASFLRRVAEFHNKIEKQQGFVLVIGHGQFFKAFQLGLSYGFNLNPTWMSLFRENEITNPIKNTEIIKIDLN